MKSKPIFLKNLKRLRAICVESCCRPSRHHADQKQGYSPGTWSVNGTQIMRTNSCYMNNESNPFYLHIGYLNFHLTFSSWVSACGGKRKSTNGILLLYEEALLITILFHFCCSHKVYLLYHPSLIVPKDSNLGQKTSD